MSMDEHEKAMREAANVPDFEYDGSEGMYHPTLTTMECNEILDLIREQVRRMDETCVSRWDNGYFRLTKCASMVDVSYNFCPKCGKRIKIEANEEKETNK